MFGVPLRHTSAVTALSFTGFTNNDRPSTLVTRTFPLGKLSREDIMELAPYFTLLQKYLRKNNPQIVRGLVQALAHTIIGRADEPEPVT